MLEVLLGPHIYDTNTDKSANHTLTLNNTQTNEQLNSNTAWILTINYGKSDRIIYMLC
jgi:hypothetical protein